MDAMDATELKANLGEVLARAAVGTLAIRRHGRVVAYLVPAREFEPPSKRQKGSLASMRKSLSRSVE